MGEHTLGCDDNLLGITDKVLLNEEEARGVLRGIDFILNQEEDKIIDVQLILNLHKSAFGHIYNWAGEIRTSVPNVGTFIPPSPEKIRDLLIQFVEQLNYFLSNLKTKDDLVHALAFAHHRLVSIHPFINCNGRTSRLLTDFIALQKGYKQITIYHREQGDKRNIYLQALKSADDHNLKPLEDLIKEQLIALEDGEALI